MNIDYPEYDDVEEMTHKMLKEKSTYVSQEIKKLLQTSDQGKILREGLSTVIVGRPNVGKSSLLNSLVHENKAIVTDIPGTTRDVIEEYVNVRGVPLRLIRYSWNSRNRGYCGTNWCGTITPSFKRSRFNFACLKLF